MKRFLALSIALIPFMAANSANAFTSELTEIERVIETEVGTKVQWSNGSQECKDQNFGVLYGFYQPSQNRIVICQKNHQRDYDELVRTLRHEGWHAVQHRCRGRRASLSDHLIRSKISQRDRESVMNGYHHSQHRSEAEARVVEFIPTPNWIKGVRHYCSNVSAGS